METESNHLHQLVEAQGFFITGAYPVAKEKLTAVLTSQPNNYDALIARAYTNLKLNEVEEALKDAEAAVAANSNKSEGLLVKGIALFHQGKFDAALSEIQRAKLVVSGLDGADARKVEVQKWEQRAEAEKTKRATVNANNLVKKVEEQKSEKSNTVQHHPQAGKVTYKWRQTDNRIYVDIIFSLKNKDDLKIKIENKRVEVSFPIDSSKSFELNLDLFDEIDAAVSVHNILLDRIEIQLEKVNKGRNWTFLERPDSQNERVLETATPQPVSQNAAQTNAPFYPSSSKVKKDWSKIDKEIEEDMKKNKDDYADEDPLNSFFKQIYSGADENTRKAMIKSFQTSGGTVLSTNWDEVKDKQYEGKDRPSAPEGQEYKQWGK